MKDAYEVARFVAHYHAKNGYAPRISELGVTAEQMELLLRNNILELRPLIEGGDPVGVVLTEKGLVMSRTTPKRYNKK